MTDKPLLGYTGASVYYANGYEVRIRVYRVMKARKARNPGEWTAKYAWDVFHNGEFQVSATSLRLAEQWVDEQQRTKKRT